MSSFSAASAEAGWRASRGVRSEMCGIWRSTVAGPEEDGRRQNSFFVGGGCLMEIRDRERDREMAHRRETIQNGDSV